MGCKLYTSDLGYGTCPKASVFAEVWHKCFSDFSREFCYLADCADLSFTFNLCIDNIELEWSGFSDRLSYYVVETLKKIVAMRGTQIKKTFDQSKEQLLQQMGNFYFKNPYKVAESSLETVMIKKCFERRQLRELLKDFNYE